MTPEETQLLLNRVALLERKLAEFYYPDRYQFPRPVRFTGTRQSFFGGPLVSKGAAITPASAVAGAFNQTNLQTIADATNTIITRLHAMNILS